MSGGPFKMHILIATKQPDLRLAIELYLIEEPGLEFVGTVSDAASLRALLQASHPDLVLLDWELPGPPATNLLAEVRTLDPHLQVIVLGSDLDAKPTALAAGADAFVLIGSPPRHLLTAVQQARTRQAPVIDNETTNKKGE
jgi:DNA-binding NarL/FixJ family response regulator